MKSLKNFTKKAYKKITEDDHEKDREASKEVLTNKKLETPEIKGFSSLDDHSHSTDQENVSLSKKGLKARSGSYNILIHAIEARDLVTLSKSLDPILVATLLNVKRKTKRHRKTISPVFDEILLIERFIDHYEFPSLALDISVFDSSKFGKGTLVGSYRLDLSYLYFERKRLIKQQWIALHDPTFHRQGIQGYLRMSLTISHEDDDPLDLLAEETNVFCPGELESQTPILLPPNIEESVVTLEVVAHEIRDLNQESLKKALVPNAGNFFSSSKNNFYLKLKFLGGKVKTSSFPAKDIGIEQKLVLPLIEPVLSQPVELALWKKGLVGGSKPTATVNLNYAEIRKGRLSSPFWIYLYGALPVDWVSSNVSMNETFRLSQGPDATSAKVVNRSIEKGLRPGNFCLGRVLVSLTVNEEKRKVHTEPVAILDKSSAPPLALYAFVLDLYELLNLDSKQKCAVVLAIGGNCYSSRTTRAVNGCFAYYQRISGEFKGPIDVRQCPKVFLYLRDNKGIIAFMCFDFADLVFNGWNHTSFNRVFRAFPGVSTKLFPGELLFSFSAGLLETKPATLLSLYHSAHKSEKSAAISEPKSKHFELKVKNLLLSGLPEKFVAADPSAKLHMEIQLGSNDLDSGNKRQTKDNKVASSVLYNTNLVLSSIVSSDSIHFRLKNKKDESVFSLEKTFSEVQEHLAGGQLGAKEFQVSAKNWCGVFSKLISHSDHVVFVLTGKISEVVTEDSESSGEHDGLSRAEKRQFQLRIMLYWAKNLAPTGNSDELADPYVVVRCAGKKMVSVVVKNSLYPEWFTTYALLLDLPDFSQANSAVSGVHIFVFDENMFMKDTFLGYASESLHEIQRNTAKTALAPKWFALRGRIDADHSSGEPLNSGAILIGMQLMPIADSDKFPIFDITPPSRPMELQLLFFGFRDLKTSEKVAKPYAKFTLSGGHVYKSKRSNLPSTENPNFCELFKIPVRMPENDLFSPVLKIEAKDSGLAGLLRKTLGFVYIDLKQFLGIRSEGSAGKLRTSTSALDISVSESTHTESESETTGTAEGLQEHTYAFGNKEESEEEYLRNRQRLKHTVEKELGGQSPFDTTRLYRPKPSTKLAQSVKDGLRKVGTFKGIVRVTDPGSGPRISRALAAKDQSYSALAGLLAKKELLVRVYVLACSSLVAPVASKAVRPLLRVVYGDKYNKQSEPLSTSSANAPEFFAVHEFRLLSPGADLLEVSVENAAHRPAILLGSASIDLEERFYNKAWQRLVPKPLETVSLRTLASNAVRGQLSLWIDMFPAGSEESLRPPIVIAPPPPQPFELRVIVWAVKNVRIAKSFTEQSDLFVTAKLVLPGDTHKNAVQRTDTHFRTSDGSGNFNWRMKFSEVLLPLPRKTVVEPRLVLQIWDKAFVARSEFVAETSLSLKTLFLRGARFLKQLRDGKADAIAGRIDYHEQTTGQPEDDEHRFWIENVRHPNLHGNQGDLQLSVELLSKDSAARFPAGFGRADPNMYPFLPKPEGRIKFSVTKPFAFLKDLLGPKAFRKLLLYGGLGVVISMLVVTSPLWAFLLFSKLF